MAVKILLLFISYNMMIANFRHAALLVVYVAYLPT